MPFNEPRSEPGPFANASGGRSVIYIIEDDEAAATSLVVLMKSINLKAKRFQSAEDFLDNFHGESGCLLLDVRLPGMGGLDLQRHLAGNNFGNPIIFMSGHADEAIAQRAIEKGAIAFLQKPFKFSELHAAIQAALARSVESDSGSSCMNLTTDSADSASSSCAER